MRKPPPILASSRISNPNVYLKASGINRAALAA
jgi:hypothetical protein